MVYFRAMAFLVVSDVSKEEKGNFVVQHLSFEQKAFQRIAIVGETGSGKTSLLKMIAGLIAPTSGEIQFEGEKILGPNDQLIPGHPGIGYLSQYFELRNNYWVHDLLEITNKLTEAQAKHLYQICQIDHLTSRRTNQLSGGEKQRIALAGLLTNMPRLLLLDEPFSNLDAVHKRTIKQVMHDLGEQMKISFIMVSHDALDILSWADTILVMKEGVLIQQGSAKEVYQFPVNAYAAGLLGDYTLVDPAKKTIFHHLSTATSAGKKLLIRPEQLQISQHKIAQYFTGIVEQVLYWGAYSTIDIKVDQQLIRARVDNNYLAKGDTVHFALTPETSLHFLA